MNNTIKAWSMRKSSPKVFIRGLAVPSNWNKDGQVLGVSIKTFDEDEYVVSDPEAIQELQAFLRKEVVLNGVVTFSGDKKILTVCRLKKLETSMRGADD